MSGAQLVAVSAPTREGLLDQLAAWPEMLGSLGGQAAFADVAATSCTRRAHHAIRFAAVGDRPADVSSAVGAVLADSEDAGAFWSQAAARPPGITFVFSGQGPQWPGMARRLMRTELPFLRALQRCDEPLRDALGWSVVDLLDGIRHGEQLDAAIVAQPLLFAVQVALAEQWAAWGVEPVACIGHSLGEVAAAHVAGALTLEDAVTIVVARSRALHEVAGEGRMLAVALPEADAIAVIADLAADVGLAAVNSAHEVVLTGRGAAVAEAASRLARDGVFVRELRIPFPAHSPLVDPMLDGFETALAGIAPRDCSRALWSTVTGRRASGAALDAAHWRCNLRDPVRFGPAVEALLAEGDATFVELSPHPVLGGALERVARDAGVTGPFRATLRRDEEDRTVMLRSLAALWRAGHPLDLAAIGAPGAEVARLPRVRWRRERHWAPDAQRGPRRQQAVVTPDAPGPLGRRVEAGPELHAWERTLDGSRPWLSDHRVLGAVVVPAAAFLEAAARAATEIMGPGSHVVSDLEISEPLVLSPGSTLSVRVEVRPGQPGAARFAVFSAAAELTSGGWRLQHVAATLRQGPPSTPGGSRAARATGGLGHAGEAVDPAEHYATLRARGLDYGPLFQGVTELRREDAAATGRVVAPEGLSGYEDTVHPAMLDAALQVFAHTLPADVAAELGSDILVPVGVRQARVLRPAGRVATVRAALGSDARLDDEDIRGDLHVIGEDGQDVVEILGLHLRRLRRRVGRQQDDQIGAWLHEVHWQSCPPAVLPDPPARAPSGHWLILGRPDGPGPALRELLDERGERAILVVPSTAYAGPADGRAGVRPGESADLARVVEELRRSDEGGVLGVVCLWAAGLPGPLDAASLRRATDEGFAAVVALVQALAPEGLPPLWLVTRGVQTLEGELSPVAAAQAPLWGLGRTLALEHPEAGAVRIDLDPRAPSTEARELLGELFAEGDEQEIAFRDGRRFVARLRRLEGAAAARGGTAIAVGVQAFRLVQDAPGRLDTLALAPATRGSPAAGEVEIRVEVAGLNFADVMKTLAVVGDPEGGPPRLGLECAGTVLRVGDDVSRVAVGDHVVALAPAAFGSCTTTLEALVAPKPALLSFEEAATLPVAFITALYGLDRLAKLQPGERVLIHAAAGGVGQAAVQLAQARGCEIFATAGSAEKRDLLTRLGVPHVLDSRTTAFAAAIDELTGGEGVDVVLNSLAGEGMAAGLSCLGDLGRFVEIGKTEIYGDGVLDLAPFRRNLSYFAVDLEKLSAERPELVRELLDEVLSLLRDGEIAPLPRRVFGIEEPEAAFRHMARRQSTGKVLLSLADRQVGLMPSPQEPVTPRTDGTYLLTGGLGGIGLALAGWLVERGARHVALLGRSAPSPGAEDAIAALRRTGAEVTVLQADVADRAAFSAALERVRSDMPPIRGVVHAAGVLDDAIVLGLDRERTDRVMAPKAVGALHLDELTREDPIELFVALSSAAAVLGSPGQAAYAAANAFVEALVRRRRVEGLPAHAIAYGPWSEVGMAATPDRVGRLAEGGVQPVTTVVGLAGFGWVLGNEAPHVAVMAADWQRVSRALGARASLLRDFAADAPAHVSDVEPASSGLGLQEILGAPAHERIAVVRHRLAEHAGRVLGLPADRVPGDRPLNTLGLDSLMAIELKNAVEGLLPVSLSLAELLEGLDLDGLAQRLVDQLPLETGPPLETGLGEVQGVPPPPREPVPGAARDEDAPARVAAAVRAVPDPDHRHVPFALNEIQRAYVAGRSGLLPLGDVSLHCYMELESVNLDLPRLERALRHMIARHDMLRAVVREDGLQQILPEVPPYVIEVVDATDRPAAVADAAALAVRDAMSHQVLPADRWPLFGVRAVRLDDRRTRLHVGIDGLIVDAASLIVFSRQLFELYERPDTRLPPLELSFRDYVLAERAMEGTDEHRRSWDYWLSRLETLPSGPDLPLACSPAQLRRQRFVRLSSELDGERWAILKRRGRDAGLTPSQLLCAAFVEVLAAWSRHGRFTVNVTTYRRLPVHPQVHELIGDFTSLTLLEVDRTEPLPFGERAGRLRAQLLRDLEHRAVNGVTVLRELARREGMARASMPVVFTSTLTQDSGGGDITPLERLGEVVHTVTQTPQVWLDHHAFEREGALAVSWDVVEDLFPRDMPQDMFAAYTRLLADLADDDRAWADPAPLRLPAAQLERRAAVNADRAPIVEGLLHEGFSLRALEAPDATAIITSSRRMTYGELHRRATRLAEELRRRGVIPGRLVGILMDKGWEQVVAVLGILQAGAAYLPLDASLPAERLAYMVEHGEVDTVIVQPWSVVPPGLDAVEVDGTAVGDAELVAWEHLQTPDDLAYVIFTSGSTGRPKGVMMEHRGTLNTIVDLNDRYAVGPEDRFLCLSSLSFDLSVYDLFGALAAGGALVIPDAEKMRDPAHWAALADEAAVTIWNSVPAFMQMAVELLAARGAALPASLRLVMLSGDWIPVALPGAIRAVAPSTPALWSLGGATEAAIWSVAHHIGEIDPAWSSIPYGVAMRNQAAFVLGPDLEERPEGVIGELHIGGTGLARGYWRDEDRTRAAFVLHPRTGARLYRTGDLARHTRDGWIEFLGREDSQIQLQGFRVELGEIEHVLEQHDGVRTAVAHALGSPGEGLRLGGWYVPEPGHAPSAAELREFARAKLPVYMVPSAFVAIAEVPLSSNGKVDRKRLPDPASAGSESKIPVPAGDGRLIGRLTEVVEDVLGVDGIEPDQDLLDLGASSLDLIRIVNRLEEQLGARPEVDQLFEVTTLRGLADFYESRGAGSRRDEQAPVTRRPTLLDPNDIEAFKRTRPGLRDVSPEAAVKRLAAGGPDSAPFVARRSHRTFEPTPVNLTALAGLLEPLREIDLGGSHKRRYGSGGALYPVATYVYARPGGVEGLAAGLWYHDPRTHTLVAIAPDARLERRIHAPQNQAAADAAAFEVLLVADVGAMEPVYGELTRDYCLVEAGAMLQLVSEAAPDLALGVCSIGFLDFSAVRPLLGVDERHELCHALVGGAIDPVHAHAEARTSSGGGETAPASPAQRRLWLTQQITPGSHAYNEPLAVRWRGELDEKALAASLRELVRRHDVLRTGFAVVDGDVMQVVSAGSHAELEVVATVTDDPEREATELLSAEVRRPFDLSQASLVRAMVVRTGTREGLLCIVMHHAIADFWSARVLLEELSLIYGALASGRPSPLTDPAPSYASYAARESARAARGDLEEDMAFWRGTLAPELPVLDLPADRARPPVPRFEGDIMRFALPADAVAALGGLGRRERATPHMVWLTLFAALLHRMTADPEVVVGALTANRTEAGIERLVGPLVNLLPLRLDVSGDPSLSELVRRTRATALAAYSHAEVPFDRLVDQLDLVRDPSRPPLAQVAFLLEEREPEGLALPGVEISPYRIHNGAAKFDLVLRLARDGGQLVGEWEFSTELFEPSTIAALGAEFSTLAERWAASPATSLSEVVVPVDAGDAAVARVARSRNGTPRHRDHEAGERRPGVRPPAGIGGSSDGASPDDGLEGELVALWQEVLGVSTVTPHDDFFDLGGSSLLAVRLVTRLEERLGRHIPFAALFSERTVERLAHFLRDERSGGLRGCVELASGPGQPCFWIHPVGGGVSAYVPLARRMAARGAFVALQAPGLEAGESPLRSAERLAAHHVDAIVARRPAGPFQLAGWSAGGTLALEMAGLLERRGEEVASVVLVDTLAPGVEGARWRFDDGWLATGFLADLGGMHGVALHVQPDELAGLDAAAQAATVVDVAARAGLVPSSREEDALVRRLEVFCATARAVVGHVPAPVRARVTVVRATDGEDPVEDAAVEAWQRWSPGVDLRSVKGDHYSILREPLVADLAASVGDALAGLPGLVP